MNITDTLHEHTVWDRKKSALVSVPYVIMHIFLRINGGSVALDSTKVQNNPNTNPGHWFLANNLQQTPTVQIFSY